MGGSKPVRCIAHDRSKEFHWKFNQPVAARMIQLQNPLLRLHKTTKGNFSGEDFSINLTVSFLDDSDSLAQIMPYWPQRPLFETETVWLEPKAHVVIKI